MGRIIFQPNSNKFTVSIDSILGGISPNVYRGRIDQFATSIGIDPDLPRDPDSTSDIKTGGILTPVSQTDFTSTALNGWVNWLITCPQNENVYAYLGSTGRLLSYSSALTSGSETNIGTPTSGAGNGAAYYHNYIYLATPTDISRYGPLDNSPVLTNTVWTGATLGSKNALGNPAYPTQTGITYPNHPMHVHINNRLYVGDFETSTASTSEGQGKIHFINTNSGTDPGDTNNGTTQDAFFLPPNYAPIDIESWGNDVVILAIPMNKAGGGVTTIQGKAALFFWDPTNTLSLPYYVIPLIDPFASALLNINGELYIWSGSLNNGVRLSKYTGGNRLQQIAFFEEGYPPPAGAIDGFGNRIVWGAKTTYSENSSCVYAYGYKDANIPPTLQNIITTTHTTASAGGANRAVSALKYAQQASFTIPRMLVAWKDGGASEDFGIDKYTASSAELAVWRSLNYQIGRPFKLNKLIFTLAEGVSANTTIVPSIRTDDENTSLNLTTVNTTNYPNSERRIVMYPGIHGNTNFSLQFRWTGTNSVSISLPIEIEGETLENATA